MSDERNPIPGVERAPAVAVSADRRVLILIALAVALLAIGAFTLSFDALRELAVIAGLRVRIAWLWPLIVDGFILIATAAAVMLRSRGWRGTAYPWATLVVFAAVSVAGNALHASNNADRSAVSVSVAAIVSAVPAIALLLASHLLVVLLTPPKTGLTLPTTTVNAHFERFDTTVPGESKSTGEAMFSLAGAEAIGAVTSPPKDDSVVTPLSAAPAKARPAGIVSGTRHSDHDLERWVIAELDAGRTVTGAAIADQFGVSPATGRRRLAGLRESGRPLAGRL